ncbi:MAG: hypothetical protein IKJ99_09660 [Oscillospiraceae bacterium]|nr:hypothetical protein [Oscillospiraceae bacterium]
MAEFKMEIAGYTALIHSLFESTKDYLKPYFSEKEPEFAAEITREDLIFEQKELLEEARLEGFRKRIFTDMFLERAAIQRKFAEFLFERDVLLFHGSTIAVEGRAYLFTAKSGTGKSTHTRLWREVFGNRAVMVNDDKPFLKITEEGVFACGSPWSGKHGLDANITLPLQGICVLERGVENRIRRAERAEVIARLRHEAYCPLDPGKEEKFLALVDALAEKTRLWHMECNKNPEAARIAFDAMSA